MRQFILVLFAAAFASLTVFSAGCPVPPCDDDDIYCDDDDDSSSDDDDSSEVG